MDATPATSRHMHQLLPLLPSGPDGVHNLALREDRCGTRSRRQHAEYIMTINVKTVYTKYGGEGGIRTLGTG